MQKQLVSSLNVQQKKKKNNVEVDRVNEKKSIITVHFYLHVFKCAIICLPITAVVVVVVVIMIAVYDVV